MMSDTVLIFIPLLLFFLVLVFTMIWTERTGHLPPYGLGFLSLIAG